MQQASVLVNYLDDDLANFLLQALLTLFLAIMDILYLEL